MWKRFLLLALMVLVGLPAESRVEDDSVLWPEHQRAFLHDGPGLLLTEAQRTELRALGPAEREPWIEEFLRRDPLPETPTRLFLPLLSVAGVPTSRPGARPK